MIKRTIFSDYLDELLMPGQVPDYTVNGLQVEGSEHIYRLVTGVTANQILLEEAAKWVADVVLVHHGFFWKNEPNAITGPKKRRMQTLLANDINLYAYHLPLDMHLVYGNNAMLAHHMGWQWEALFEVAEGLSLGCLGRLLVAKDLDGLAEDLYLRLGQTPLVIAGGNHSVKTLAWCTGAGQDFIEQAAAFGVDAFVTGEISERTTHLARELGIHFIAAGHHATERGGVKALGDHLANHFALEHCFIDVDNPV